ncbi:hypothetical protein E2C01_060668 [Portunus trituberculatus]|uniref:Uncharacterized protein n=1 Tax=Portunus trituberculatus TaxID=210409 RepID=A0A5B7H360_PORTR|nr:hypothetical protein [Portunus trituberculatus]
MDAATTVLILRKSLPARCPPARSDSAAPTLYTRLAGRVSSVLPRATQLFEPQSFLQCCSLFIHVDVR